MFSYRHAFHAGNHADVLKHTVLIAALKHLTEKDAALAVVDSHAGAGLYRLGGEAAEGFVKLLQGKAPAKDGQPGEKYTALSPALQDYVDLIAGFNKPGSHKVYPGSPFIMQRLLREHDRLKLFELHPTDSKTLDANIAQLDAGRQVDVFREDGFEGWRRFVPPPSRRAFLLCDPSYEVKTDYARVVTMVGEALKRFATGTYAVWYPIIPRPEAHDLPRKLKAHANRAGKSWLHATLTVKFGKVVTDATGATQRPGLPASGMFLINPPYTLQAALALALPQMVERLGQDKHAGFTLEAGGK